MSEPKTPENEPVEGEIVEDDTALEVPAGQAPVVPDGDYTGAGVPTFDYVRDQIEGRFATSVGASELAGDASKSVDEQFAERDKAGRDKLEEIRRSMRE